MFRKLTNKLSEAMFGSAKVQQLVSMGFDPVQANNALEAANGNVDQAAELLLGGTMSVPAGGGTSSASQRNSSAQPMDVEDATLQRVMQESLRTEQRRQQTATTRTAAMNMAAEAASRRASATATGTSQASRKKVSLSRPRKASSKSPPRVASGVAVTHPSIKLVPKLSDKSKEEQILRCTDRLKNHCTAVDTLHRALIAVQGDAGNAKFRTINPLSAGYQRSVAPAAGAQDLLNAMNFRLLAPDRLYLDRSSVDPALLYLGISALEQTMTTPEYMAGKAQLQFGKDIKEATKNSGENSLESGQRVALVAQCPKEPPEGRGAWMQVTMGGETFRRRFDGDDTLQDILHWLGGFGSVIPAKILRREWSLVDVNRFPVTPMDCEVHQKHTLQFLGCWPSGRLEVTLSTPEWKQGNMDLPTKVGSSRGLGAAPAETVYSG